MNEKTLTAEQCSKLSLYIGVKRFDPYIPAWCPKLSKNGGVKQ